MSHDARKVTPPPVLESGVRDLRGQLVEQRKQLETLQKKNAALGDELEDVTVRLLRAEAELATAKEREAESAKQWLAMSADLSTTRARVAKHERLLERVTEMLAALNDRARGSVVESEIDAIVGVLELHRPERDE
jgi:chromosome segregation ATPase